MMKLLCSRVNCNNKATQYYQNNYYCKECFLDIIKIEGYEDKDEI